MLKTERTFRGLQLTNWLTALLITGLTLTGNPTGQMHPFKLQHFGPLIILLASLLAHALLISVSNHRNTPNSTKGFNPSF